MKKATLLAIACAIFMGQSALAQENTEVTYVADPSQGYLFNRFKDNWFITAEGGAGMYFSHADVHRNVSDRFSPAASLYVGKWFSPVIALRAGFSWMQLKGLGDAKGSLHPMLDEPMINGYYKQKFNEAGLAFDAMVNLTNWWCGYKPNRVYNAIVYAGAGAYLSYAKMYDKNGKSEGWKDAHDGIAALRAGIINSFNVSKQVALSLDIRWTGLDKHPDELGANREGHNVQAFLGVTYLFKNREWKAPVVPVCPEPENCDALRARLAAADARIADLEAQLRNALNRPVEKVEVNKAPLATIYYPIGVSTIGRREINVLGAVAEAMKSNPSKKYILTGWADNYTGNDQINTRLRHARANGVEKQLVRFGVDKAQLTTTINAGNLCDLGEKYVALDRAVTIEEAK